MLVIDEISQVAPRALLALLELQPKTGLAIKALGDREQAQSVEAGDTIEIMRRVLSRADMPELLSTVRQVGHSARQTWRLREVAVLFRGNEPDPDGGDEREGGQRGRKMAGSTIADGDAMATAEARQRHHLDEVHRALAMKREDGTACFVRGDHDQVLGRIADFYMERRDLLRASGSRRGITVSVVTNLGCRRCQPRDPRADEGARRARNRRDGV